MIDYRDYGLTKERAEKIIAEFDALEIAADVKRPDIFPRQRGFPRREPKPNAPLCKVIRLNWDPK